MILVTNDDGDSRWVRLLLEVAKEFGEVYALIPERQQSGVSKRLTFHKPLRVNEIGKDIYTLNGTPADCVNFGIFSDDFSKPDIILSGINEGNNISLHTIMSSGTVGAGFEALLHGIPSLCISKERGKSDAEGMKEAVRRVVGKWIKNPPKDVFFNVNIPSNPEGSEIVFAEPQDHQYTINMEKRKDPNGKAYYWVHGERDLEKEKGKDGYELKVNNNIVITPIKIKITGTKEDCKIFLE